MTFTNRNHTVRTSSVACGIALMIALLHFASSPANADDRKPADKAAAQAALVAWLDCVECTDGELKKLLPHAALVGPALGTILVQGPSPAEKARTEDRLHAQWRALSPKARVYSEKEYVEIFSAKAAARYQVKAAQALALFAAPAYDRYLLEASSNKKLNPAVQQAVVDALEKRKLTPAR